MRSNDSLPELTDRHIGILKIVRGDGQCPICHEDQIRDVSFFDRKAMLEAGWIVRVRAGNFRGWKITGKGLEILSHTNE
ncbi:hypothetical protein HH303_18865 [Rhodospirillaceae bacterium KN72]|uniref:Uncharacterized protein n=1 Tax=Pacificispira spongiicola TaxID=2729598 RepID=A0A7Y0E3H4_9PROT|nr:hypothetical protein [Pacificispira spongiicola]NMM46560.1 hypothetical protein [Pacificispira spongiicola]